MNLSNFFQNLKNQNISLFSFFIIAILLLTIIVFLIIAIIYLYKKIKYLTKVRYGFGGKPLFSLLIVFGVMVAIPLTYYSAQQSVNYVNLALGKKDAIIKISIIEREEEVCLVSFLAIPTIDGESWGNNEFTITWDIQGVSDYKKTEVDRDKENPSYFSVKMLKGTYNIHIVIEGKNFYLEKDEVVVIE